MSCTYHDRNETMLAYIRQELTPEAQEAFEEHYFICEECASDVLFYEKTTLTMRGQGGIVFARPKRGHELIASIEYAFNRWRRNFALIWEEGSTAKALAGYALLIIFLSTSSLLLLQYLPHTSTRNFGEMDSGFTPTRNKTQNVAHLDWPAHLKLTTNSELQIELAAIQSIYQEQRNYAAASVALERIVSSKVEVNAELKVFLAACWAQQNRKAEAKTLLESISAPLPPSAQKLLQNLR